MTGSLRLSKSWLKQHRGLPVQLYDGKKKFPDVAEKFFLHVNKLPDIMRGPPDGKKKFFDVVEKFFLHVKKLPDVMRGLPDGKKKLFDVAEEFLRHMKKLPGGMKKFADEKIKCVFQAFGPFNAMVKSVICLLKPLYSKACY